MLENTFHSKKKTNNNLFCLNLSEAEAPFFVFLQDWTGLKTYCLGAQAAAAAEETVEEAVAVPVLEPPAAVVVAPREPPPGPVAATPLPPSPDLSVEPHPRDPSAVPLPVLSE